MNAIALELELDRAEPQVKWISYQPPFSYPREGEELYIKALEGWGRATFHDDGTVEEHWTSTGRELTDYRYFAYVNPQEETWLTLVRRFFGV